MQKSEVIKDVLEHLLIGNSDLASEVAKDKYPFAEFVAEQRKYSFVEMTNVFLRDGFIDRYSGEKLLFPGIFKVLELQMPNEFPAHKNWKMTETHIVYWELFPTIDHIFPISRGGNNEERNLVTTSMQRNSAKAHWTLDELGWTIKEAGKLEEWDGLCSLFLKFLNKDNQLRKHQYIRKWETALLKAQDLLRLDKAQ